MIDSLINRFGSDSQRERHQDGRLPEQELRALACSVLFQSIDMPRFKRLDDVFHERGCTGTGFAGESIVEFKVNDDYRGPMSTTQWESWKKIRDTLRAFPPLDLAPHVGVVAHKIREHHGECVACGAQKRRLSVLVTAQFFGMTLSREYAL